MESLVCNYCGEEDQGDHKKKRTGLICLECLKKAQSDASTAKQKLQNYRTSGDGILALLLVVGALIAFVMGYAFIAVLLVVMALGAGSVRSGKADPKTIEKRKVLELAESSARGKLQSIYAQFIEPPPDWRERRRAVKKRDGSKCRECGKKFYSEYGFHLHHLIPKSKPESSHKLSNLVLLCERCHKKHHPWMR